MSDYNTERRAGLLESAQQKRANASVEVLSHGFVVRYELTADEFRVAFLSPREQSISTEPTFYLPRYPIRS